VKQYLSFGGGVNSTALLLMLSEEVQRGEIEAVFVDHGTDYPETYAYVEMLLDLGYPITVLKPDNEGFDNLYDYAMAAGFVPMRTLRWCTDKFKIRPLYAHFERPCRVYIGIDADEERRARDSRDPEIENVFPLVERGIGRQGCVEIIEAHNLPVPPKSGCFICPFQRRSQWIDLNANHPDLWCKAVTLEAESRVRDKRAVITDRPLEELIRAKDARGRYAAEDQESLFDDRRPCQCGL
jgi:hypothetical protein